jgi:hypothetical protein
MKFKQKSKCSSNKVNKTLLLQLFVVIGVGMLITCASGCKTGGKRLNPNSAGTIIRTSDPRSNFQPLPPIPITPPKSTPATTSDAVRSRPVLPEPKSAEANPVVITPEPAGETEPFTPTISTPPVKLPPVKLPPVKLPPVKLPPIKAEVKLPAKLIKGDSGSVVITDDDGAAGKDPQIAGSHEAAPVKESTNNWLGLFSFYIICLLGLIILWVVYDIIKDAIQMKKQGSPINDHLENLKKPAKGTRKSRKKAITRKNKK